MNHRTQLFRVALAIMFSGAALLAGSARADTSMIETTRPGTSYVVNTPQTPLFIANTPRHPFYTLNLAAEPGRLAYQERRKLEPSDCPGTDFCKVTFSPVPDQRRLVVTFISAQFSWTDRATDARVGVGNDNDDVPFFEIPVTAVSHNRYLGSSPVTFYVHAGQTPAIFIHGSKESRAPMTGSASIVGYFIDQSLR